MFRVAAEILLIQPITGRRSLGSASCPGSAHAADTCSAWRRRGRSWCPRFRGAICAGLGGRLSSGNHSGGDANGLAPIRALAPLTSCPRRNSKISPPPGYESSVSFCTSTFPAVAGFIRDLLPFLTVCSRFAGPPYPRRRDGEGHQSITVTAGIGDVNVASPTRPTA